MAAIKVQALMCDCPQASTQISVGLTLHSNTHFGGHEITIPSTTTLVRQELKRRYKFPGNTVFKHHVISLPLYVHSLTVRSHQMRHDLLLVIWLNPPDCGINTEAEMIKMKNIMSK